MIRRFLPQQVHGMFSSGRLNHQGVIGYVPIVIDAHFVLIN